MRSTFFYKWSLVWFNNRILWPLYLRIGVRVHMNPGLDQNKEPLLSFWGSLFSCRGNLLRFTSVGMQTDCPRTKGRRCCEQKPQTRRASFILNATPDDNDVQLCFMMPVSKAARPTTVQKRGQNHQRSPRASRIRSTRKTIPTTKPLDCREKTSLQSVSGWSLFGKWSSWTRKHRTSAVVTRTSPTEVLTRGDSSIGKSSFLFSSLP